MKKLFLLILLSIYIPVFAADYVDGKKSEEFEVTQWGGISAPSVSPSNYGRLYFDSTAKKFKYSENGGTYTALGTGTSSYLNFTTNETSDINWTHNFTAVNLNATSFSGIAESIGFRCINSSAIPIGLQDRTIILTQNYTITGWSITSNYNVSGNVSAEAWYNSSGLIPTINDKISNVTPINLTNSTYNTNSTITGWTTTTINSGGRLGFNITTANINSTDVILKVKTAQ